MIAACRAAAIVAWLMEGNPFRSPGRRRRSVAAVYLALVGSVLAAWLNYWLLARVGAVNLLIMGLIEPPSPSCSAPGCSTNAMNSRALVGGAMILVSVWLAMAASRQAREMAT